VDNSKTHPITRNLFSLITGQTFSLLLNFLSITLIARHLGVKDFGVFSYTIALVTIISKVIDFGLVPITFRESSKGEDNFRFLNTAFTIRLILFSITIVAFNSLAALMKISTVEILLSNILMLNVILSSKFQNFRELLDIPYKISLKSHHSMIASTIDNLLLVILIIGVINFNLGIYFVVWAYVLSNIPGFCYLVFILYKKYNYKFRFTFYRTSWFIRESLPLFVYVSLAVLIQQIDVLLLKNLDSEYSVGIYSAAMRLTLPLMIIPSAIVSTIFPTLVRNVGSEDSRSNFLNSLIFKILFLISFVFAVIVGFKTNDFIAIIFGNEFKETSIPLILLLITQVFLFSNFFTINLLTIYSKQKNSMLYALIVLIVNFILNLLLIPIYSFNGAGFSKLIAVAIGTFVLSFVTKASSISITFFNLRFFVWIILILSVTLILSYLNFVLYIILLVSAISILTLKLKFFSDEEILLILKLINKEKWSKAILKL